MKTTGNQTQVGNEPRYLLIGSPEFFLCPPGIQIEQRGRLPQNPVINLHPQTIFLGILPYLPEQHDWLKDPVGAKPAHTAYSLPRSS